MTARTKQKILWSGIMILVFAASAFGQFPEEPEEPANWHLSFISGYFSGDGIVSTRTKPAGEPIKVESDAAWLIGARFGAEQEYLGWEATAAGAFADLDVKAKPGVALSSGRDLSVFLGNLNALYFPFGNSWAQGRLRPFVTAGAGLAHFDSNFDDLDSETTFDVNAGAGIKVLLGETGKYFLRLDWRWHYLTGGGSGLDENLYRQELTLGIGVRF